LLLAAAYMLTVVVLALEIPLGMTLRRSQESDVTSRILSYTAIVASAINDDLAAIATPNQLLPDPEPAIASVADFAADRSQARMVVVDALGRIVYDTAGQAPAGTQYATGRPEFANVLAQDQGALPDARRGPAEPNGPSMLLITAPVLHDREVIGAVGASLPISELDEGVVRSWVGLVAIGLAVIAVGLVLAWFLARSIARPVERHGRTGSAHRRRDRQCQEVVHQRRQPRQLDLRLGGLLAGETALTLDRLEPQAHAGHRCSELVRGVRDEVALRREVRLERAGHAVEGRG